MDSRKREFIRVCLIAVVTAVVALAAAGKAWAQFSPTGPTAYDQSHLTGDDWKVLGKDILGQAFRGSMMLVFPDRPPITDSAKIKEYVTGGKPLRGVAYPGLNADPASGMAMAKQIAVVNARADGKQQPVLAVNSGWTDWFATQGHLVELATVRRSVDQGKAFKADPVSGRVARMLNERFKKGESAPVTLYGHSAGVYYASNTAFLMLDKQPSVRRHLRVYSQSLSARVPAGIKAAAFIGDRDAIGHVNTQNPALLKAKIKPGQSHVGGELWQLGDSLNGVLVQQASHERRIEHVERRIDQLEARLER